MGIRAVLSQKLVEDNKLHPCAILSKTLSLAERNYNVCNRELLALKAALEHWLEGANQLFLMWTDHRSFGGWPWRNRLGSVWQHVQCVPGASPLIGLLLVSFSYSLSLIAPDQTFRWTL